MLFAREHIPKVPNRFLTNTNPNPNPNPKRKHKIFKPPSTELHLCRLCRRRRRRDESADAGEADPEDEYGGGLPGRVGGGFVARQVQGLRLRIRRRRPLRPHGGRPPRRLRPVRRLSFRCVCVCFFWFFLRLD